MDIEKLTSLRYNCLLLGRPTESGRDAKDVIADATAYYDFCTSAIPVPNQVPANLDDEIPF